MIIHVREIQEFRLFSEAYSVSIAHIITYVLLIPKAKCHGLIKDTDTKAFFRLFLEIDQQENFPVLICYLSRRKFIHLQTGAGGGGALPKTQKLPQKVSDGIRSLSIIYVHCHLCI